MKRSSDLLSTWLIAKDYYGNPIALGAILGGATASLLIAFYPNAKHSAVTILTLLLLQSIYLLWGYLYVKGQSLNMNRAFLLGRIVGIGMTLSWSLYLTTLSITQSHSPYLIDLLIIYNVVLISTFPTVFRYDRLVGRFIVAGLTLSLLVIGFLKFNGPYWFIYLIGSLIYAGFTGFTTESRLRSEAKLIKHQRRLEQIFDAFPGGVSLLKDLKYKTINKYLYENMPLASDIKDKPLGYHNPQQDWAIRIQDFAKSANKQIIFESNLETVSGPKTFLTSATKIAPNEIVLISLDTQELSDAKKELEAQKARSLANSKLASLGEMGAGIAHEINNPLAVLKGRLTLLDRAIQADPLDREKLIQHASKLMPMADRIEKIVRSMRNLCRTGSLDTDLEQTTFKKIIEEALVFMEARLKNYGTEIRVLGEALEEPIMAVDSQMTQVLVNAIANSHDAVQNSQEKWVELEVIRDQEHVTLLVKDSGPGIALADREKVGQPFFTTKAPGKGTGLGLSISNTIIEKHGGSLAFDHSAMVTTLKITLPRAFKASAAA